MKNNFSTIVVFRLELAAYYLVPDFAPDGNGIASYFLHKFIEHRFTEDGIEFSGPGVAPECVNQARGLWYVENRPKALDTLRATLDELRVLDFAEIGYYCRDEGYFRTVFPETPGADIARHFGTDLDALADEWHRKSEGFRFRVHFVIEQLKRPSGAFGLVKEK